MPRQASNQPTGPQLDEERSYTGTLKAVTIEPSKNPLYPDPQVKLVLAVSVDGKIEDVTDYLGIRIGQQKDGTIAKLRQLLNALAGKEREADLWLDPDALEWGYDMQPGTAPFAKLQAGNGLPAVSFRGEMRLSPKGKFYKITSYRALK